MNVFNCKVCDKRFTNRRDDSKFCSHKCYNIHREQNGIPRHYQSKGSCIDCGAVIKIKSKRCSDCNNIHNGIKRQNARLTEDLFCNKCGIEKTKENTYSPREGKWALVCRDCCKIKGRKSQEKLKQECVDYKGGCCQVCGYNKCLSALDFHHLNPKEKDFSVARKKMNVAHEKMRAELDKCVLLCANCHREEHRLLTLKEPSLLAHASEELDWLGTNSV